MAEYLSQCYHLGFLCETYTWEICCRTKLLVHARNRRLTATLFKSQPPPPLRGHITLALLSYRFHTSRSHRKHKLAQVFLASWPRSPGSEEPRAAAALRSHGDDQILAVFLELADVYGSFGRALLTLKQSIVELRAGVQRRRGDGVASLLAQTRREGAVPPRRRDAARPEACRRAGGRRLSDRRRG